jgi:hypothetical protein
VTTVAQFARATRAMGPAMRAAEVAGVREAALKGTNIIRTQIRNAAPGGTLKMNGKPKKIGASFKMLSGAKARISATGPLHLIERDTRAHYIPRAAQSSLITYRVTKGGIRATQKKRRGRAGQQKVLKIPGIGFRRMVSHPGTKGKHPFEKGVAEARGLMGRTILNEVAKGISAALR